MVKTAGAVAPAADEAACVRLAANPATSAQTLRALATDARVTVRAAVALNPSTPDGIDATLADDGDTRVRQLLGHKLARLIPGLSEGDQRHLRRHAMATLHRLVEDEAERVRAAIAAIVKDMPEAPHDLILRLARDTAIAVSEPVLRLSPVLTPSDLLVLLASPPAASTAASIAGRPGLDAEVADEIARGSDAEAIRILLENGSAQIQEATLDELIARAADQESWHEPMIRRPKLSGRAATALSEIITAQLLAVLAARPDLPPDITADLTHRLGKRAAARETPPRKTATSEEALQQARALHAAGTLDAAALREAAAQGDARLCAAMLAVAADVPPGVVERAASLRSAKGLVSLVWRAELPMDVAVSLQSLVGQIAPGAVLRSLDGTEFPLTVEEMRWQVDLLKQMGR